jgi:hypothetical protein
VSTAAPPFVLSDVVVSLDFRSSLKIYHLLSDDPIASRERVRENYTCMP